MHEELIRNLREPCPHENCILCQNAADAIEELICEVADEHNARLDAEERQRWIPVAERLPEHTNLVLVRHQSETGSKFFGLDVFDGYGWVVCLNVTHWMPLPEPPREDA